MGQRAQRRPIDAQPSAYPSTNAQTLADALLASSTDAESACAEVVRSLLNKQGTPEGEIDVDWGKTTATSAGNGQWSCHVTVNAPNVFGAKRVSTYSVAVKDIKVPANGGLTWTNVSIS